MPKIPAKNFQPAPGRLTQVAWPASARVETWVEAGTEVTPYYDPMLAKIIVHGEDRAAALAQLRAALAETAHLRHRDQSRLSAAGRRPIAAFEARRHHDVVPARLSRIDAARSTCSSRARRRRCRTIRAGSATGTSACRRRVRWTRWRFASPIDLVGNDEGAAGLEITVTGPTLRFACDTHDRADGRGFRRASEWRARCALAGDPGSGGFDAGDDDGAGRRQPRLSRDRRRHAMCRSISAAAALSCWAVRRPRRARRCARAMCCMSRRAHRLRRGQAPTV